ncbi:PIN domain-containing protein [Rhodoferax sp.]|uniref:type II toxin-antitoxin system VapC family toxin n=1 Tax=Rhodoferax sp. TaxID=50421 RepID=UPI002624D534|nr:PIN domain-containing protein [Rhodoferax sp.]MDD5480618.1 PIN domain-containing protein [Rhodoferax sp.]
MRLFLDACALIYRFEGAASFRSAATELMAQLIAQQDSVELAVSRLSVLECRVKPLREGNTVLLKRYDDFFAAVQIVELSAAVVDAATQLRARYGLKTPDALQAASAFATAQRTLFVTADAGFAKVAGLDVRLIKMA